MPQLSRVGAHCQQRHTGSGEQLGRALHRALVEILARQWNVQTVNQQGSAHGSVVAARLALQVPKQRERSINAAGQGKHRRPTRLYR